MAQTDKDKLNNSKEDGLFARIRLKTDITKFIGIVAVALLIVMEVVIILQVNKANRPTGRVAVLVTLGACSLVLDALCLVAIYAAKQIKVKIVIYCLQYALLFVFCLYSSNIYLSVLFCIVLTEVYAGLEKFRDDLILFLVSFVLYVVSFIVGRFYTNPETLQTPVDVVDIVSDVFVGLIIMTAHFVIANFLLVFYRNHKKLTKALKETEESRAELKDVYEQLSRSAVYEERNRIAGDIHDHAGHSMTVVIMQTEAAKQLIDTNPEEAKKAIISANLQAKNALEQMRESVHLLAGRKDGYSLKDAIEETVGQTMDGTDIKIRTDLDDPDVTEDEFRLLDNGVKEALSNGMRHGGATAFYIELKQTGGEIELLVSDNGTGLGTEFKEGFGLRGMREKAEALGGRLSVSGEEGDGCELMLVIPKKKEETNDQSTFGG